MKPKIDVLGRWCTSVKIGTNTRPDSRRWLTAGCQFSGDTTPCRMTGVTLHSHSGYPTRGCIPRGSSLPRVTSLHRALTEMCSGSEVGSYLRLIDSCITQLKAQGPTRTCNESKEDEEGSDGGVASGGSPCRATSLVAPVQTPLPSSLFRHLSRRPCSDTSLVVPVQTHPRCTLCAYCVRLCWQ